MEKYTLHTLPDTYVRIDRGRKLVHFYTKTNLGLQATYSFVGVHLRNTDLNKAHWAEVAALINRPTALLINTN